MPEINNENAKLREIEELERKLAEKKAAVEKEKEVPVTEAREAKISAENIKEAEVQPVPITETSAVADEGGAKNEEIAKDVKDMKNLDTARQVKILVALAFEKGISYSIKVARSLNDAYLLDELHDKLVGELHEELVKKGKLKDI
jgi:sRNA-binding protein